MTSKYTFRFIFGAILSLLLIQVCFADIDQSKLDNILEQAFTDDRTGACVLVAVIDRSKVIKSAVCAKPGELERRKLGFDTAFEIGSISKPITSLILAGLMRDQKISLDDSLATLLPEGVVVPSYEGKPIQLKHVVTHTSGLPPLPDAIRAEDISNPYASLSEQNLLDSLSKVALNRKPGSHFEYSNFAMMLLSMGLSHSADISYDSLLQRYVLSPIRMNNSYALNKPGSTFSAQGHLPIGLKAEAWTFPENLHGVGGIRSSLNDMIKFTQANLGLVDTSVNKLLLKTHKQIAKPDGQSMGMNWMRVQLNDRKLITHEGGTGGFSSLLMFEPRAKKGVVILSDTALTSLGGLSMLAVHILEPSLPLPKPRSVQPAPKDLLGQLVGDYVLKDAGLGMKLSLKDGKLVVQATGQPSFMLEYDSAGDFFPSEFDALLRPVMTAQGRSFDWMQGGGVMRASSSSKTTPPSYKPDVTLFSEYRGVYPLVKGFGLTVSTKNDTLMIQGTNQAALTVSAIAKDQFYREDVGAYFVFNRDKNGIIDSLTLKQNGQTLVGEKQ
jgi:CubicO group peptidase (beta-lactamase class C family)